ncbi:hypothetical protein E4U42_000658 [Claviceps africana]|uniref:C2H2-type domain-containing protein n=1 Tax=Claviceps africana TaxID=83212 RepID=A0A8K0J562_9HYPO|nr:hypothetical protein E4U42_000658 [Claviceps africana]
MNDDDIPSKAAAPGSRHVDTIRPFGRLVRPLWSRSFPRHVADTSVSRRHLSDGATAGAVVGAVVAAALLAFCLYPVIVHQIKRRRRADGPLDAETGIQAQHIKGSTLHPHPHRRLSSTDSFEHNGRLSGNGRLGRGIQRSRKPDETRIDANLAHTEQTPDASRHLPTATGQDACQHDVDVDAFDDEYRDETTPFPYYMPASMPDDNPGVLNGTSHDYYRPSIPSSAFGMVTAPDPIVPVRTLSRGSSLTHNLKHMFRRSSGGGASLASVLYSQVKPTSSGAHTANDPGPTVTFGHPEDSPTAFSPATTSMQPHPATVSTAASPPAATEAHAAAAAAAAAEPPSQPIVTTPPQSPRIDRVAFRPSPSPPYDPAPGTVNPMDIMPASTQSEMRHRTEHQLLASSYGSGGGPSSASDRADQEDASAFTPPPVSESSPADAAQAALSLTPTNQNALPEVLKQEYRHVPMVDLHSHDHLSPSVILDTRRHPSYPSDYSTPFPAAHSTGPSTENTPSTQLDSPSPGSMNSFDYGHSTSPQPGLASPTQVGLLFPCDEPGCSQVFDQPHKLKHHQRYHSKDHKCPYKDCGKGFGTKTHLQRHINDRHDKRKKFHCAVPGCDYSKAGGKAFPRKDNWKRHMTKIHNMDQQQLPEPIEVDSEMGNT